MREVLVVPPESAKRTARVRKVQFSASGAELAAWVNPKSAGPYGQSYELEGLYRYDLASGACARLQSELHHEYLDEYSGDAAVSPDLRWIGTALQYDADMPESLWFNDSTNLDAKSPQHTVNGRVYALFLHGEPAMCTTVVAEWNEEQDFVTRVVRFDLAQLDTPPRTVKKINPLTREVYDAPVWRFKWKTLLDNAKWDRPTCAALSANGRFLAVADEPGNVHVADLKRKRVAAVHQKARLTADRVIERVAVDDTGERVFRTANGVLHGPKWQFQPPTGTPTDFALSPDQRTVCAVFDSGHARTFDAATGAVRKELRWGKKPLYSVCFAPDGLTCAAGSTNGRVVFWDAGD